MTTSQDSIPETSWHRQPWPWLLMLAPMAAILWGGFTLWLAIRYQDPLVTEHAWQDGRALENAHPRAPAPAAAGVNGRK